MGLLCGEGERGQRDDGGRTAVGRIAGAEKTLETVGPVPFGAAMGNGAGGLQRERRGVGVFSIRTRARTGLPVGRRRDCGVKRPPSIDLLCFGDVERAGSDTERANVW